MTYREALNLALHEEMRRDERVFVIGGRSGHDDGADEMTRSLLKEFDPRRVVHTPIAEAEFTGVGIGAALVGLRPVVEMMSFNSALPHLDRLVNTAAKLCYVSGGQYNVPIVFRGPGGPPYRCARQDSQPMESSLHHRPGLKIVCPSTPADAKGLLKSAIRDDNPVAFIEPETLYGISGEVPEDPDFTIPLGQAAVRREGRDITVVASIGMLCCAMEAADELEKDGFSVEIVDLRTLRPLDGKTIAGSVRKTHRAVVVESGGGFADLVSEITAFIAEQTFDDLDAPVARVASASVPMLQVETLEGLNTPTPEKIVAALRRVCYANGN